MKLNKSISIALNIKEGEELPIFLLMLISFFMGTAVAFFYTASTSMFLAVFETKVLPHAYIASGVVGYFIWLASSKLGRKLSIANLLIAYMAFLSVSVFFISIGVHTEVNKWLPFIMFVWVRVFTFINAIVFWVLAGRIFDIRQGKRLFGLISTGEVISTILGFFSIPFLLKYIKINDLISISFVGVILCFITLIIIIKKFGSRLSQPNVPQTRNNKSSGKSLKEIFKSKYLVHVFLLAILPMFSMYFVDYVFLTQTKIEYPDKNFIAGFLGIFFGLAAIAEFVIKGIISGRLISKYGIKLGLAILPVLMLASTFLASATGTLYGTAGIFYSFIAFTKFSERVLRSSMNDPSFQILYQPLPEQERIAFQGQIEGIPKALGNVIGGFILLLFANLSFLNIIHYNYFFLVILALWVKIAFDMYTEYRKTLKNVLVKKEKRNNDKLEEESEIAMLFHETTEANPKHTDKIFALFEKINPIKTESILLRLLMQSNQSINKNIIKQIEEREMISALPVLYYCLNDETLADVKEDIQITIDILEKAKNTPFEMLSELSKNINITSENKKTIANLLGYSTRYNSILLLNEYLKDNITEVRQSAIISAGRQKRIELREAVMESLFIPECSNYAYSAIKNIGAPFLDELEVFFNRLGTNKANLPRIISLYSAIGGKKAIELLRKKINFPDKEIREHIFYALNKLEYKAASSEITFIKLVIEEEIATMVWIMAALIDIASTESAVVLVNALQYELKTKKDYILILLAIIYDSSTLQLVKENIKTGTMQSKAFALEIIDLLVSPDIKDMILPLLEDISPEECVNVFSSKFPQEKLNYHDRLIDIINKDFSRINRWTKICAIKELANFNEQITFDTLAVFFNHNDPLLMDTAMRIIYASNINMFNELLERLRIKENKLYLDFRGNKLSVLEKVIRLKNSPMFNSVSEAKLIPLAVNSFEAATQKTTEYGKHETVLKIDLTTLYYLMAGDIEIARSIVSFLTAQNNFELREFV